jgi:hypothetical protein
MLLRQSVYLLSKSGCSSKFQARYFFAPQQVVRLPMSVKQRFLALFLTSQRKARETLDDSP